MDNFLERLLVDVQETIRSGYYKLSDEYRGAKRSLKRAISTCSKTPIIAEVKPISPALGSIGIHVDVEDAVQAMVRGGAIALSILTEPRHFGGSLENIRLARRKIDLPLLMKDIIVDEIQVEAASRLGADAILLIMSVFDNPRTNLKLEDAIRLAHTYNLEVLLESHKESEFKKALESDADIIGINNRDLRSLRLDFEVARRLLNGVSKPNKLIVVESGIKTSKDIEGLKNLNIDAFLVGSAIMQAEDIAYAVRELVDA